MPRLTKIYTRQGDAGFTALGNNKISKDDLLIEALGTIDELNAHIGMILAFSVPDKTVVECLTQVQHDLFDLGGEFHVPERVCITADKVTTLEQQLDQWNADLPTLKEFILPRGTKASVACHIARTVCRRAERDMVRLHRQVSLSNPDALRYVNRLSDLLFVMSRVLAREEKQQEVMWESDKS